MDILAWKPGHDGSICLISEGKLEFSLETEKHRALRHSPLNGFSVFTALSKLPRIPNMIATSGWSHITDFCANYVGVNEECIFDIPWKFIGERVDHFSSSHEKAHIFSAYGLSDLPNGTPCYALVWEGTIGSFYHVDQHMNITRFPVLDYPGERYVLPYALAHKSYTSVGAGYNPSILAGKVMALAAFEKSAAESEDERQVIDTFVSLPIRAPEEAEKLFKLAICNMEVESSDAKRIYRRLSDRIFNIYYQFAEQNLTERLPLIIAGGCGLNCEWNTRWRNCGLFEGVFVPPCSDDTGAAIGTAIEGQFSRTGNAKIEWSVYCGDNFKIDCIPDPLEYSRFDYDARSIALMLQRGWIIAWISGRAEIGPRALGARSLLAAPFTEETRAQLNNIKERELYRPVAPICLEEELPRLFSDAFPSPHMLYFQKVCDPQLKAITHVDDSARTQSVNENQHSRMHGLLKIFKSLSGYGVLCNTSLNYPGQGFINYMSDLVSYVRNRDIQAFVVDDYFYVKNDFVSELSR